MSSSSQTNTNFNGSTIRSPDPSTYNSPSSRTSPSEIHSLHPYCSRGETDDPGVKSTDQPYRHSFEEGFDDNDDDYPSVEWLEYIDSITRPEDEVPRSVDSDNFVGRIYQEIYQADPCPATSQQFADLFPSSRRLEIRHDDATIDGNMNLRVDTVLSFSSNLKRKITLFHLRMQDLRNRKCSLRRYCRSSGREICNSSRKEHPVPRNPTLAGSLSNIFASIKPSSTTAKLKRNDSGYSSNYGDERQWSRYSKRNGYKTTQLGPPDVISLEFSNYAHLDIKRRGFARAKRYDFDYWGVPYSWKRIVRKGLGLTEVSYHLLRRSDKELVAHIVPVRLTDDEAKEEADVGGWIPPCSMWLSNKQAMDVRTGVSDVLIATGLIALVDDSIRRRFQAKEKKKLFLSQLMRSSLQAKPNQIGPKQFMIDIFGRGGKTN